MNQESNLIKIPKANFFSRSNVQPNVWLWPIAENSASVISSARLYWTLSWIKSPTWLSMKAKFFCKAECSAECSASADCKKFSFSQIILNIVMNPTRLDTYLKHYTYHTYSGFWGVNNQALFFQKKNSFKVIWWLNLSCWPHRTLDTYLLTSLCTLI